MGSAQSTVWIAATRWARPCRLDGERKLSKGIVMIRASRRRSRAWIRGQPSSIRASSPTPDRRAEVTPRSSAWLRAARRSSGCSRCCSSTASRSPRPCRTRRRRSRAQPPPPFEPPQRGRAASPRHGSPARLRRRGRARLRSQQAARRRGRALRRILSLTNQGPRLPTA